MKVLKENLTLVICGAVVLLAAAFAWYAHGWMRDPLIDEMNSRLGERGTIDTLADTPLEWPRAATQHGPPTEEMIKARQDLIKNTNDEQKKVMDESVRLNSQGRVTSNGAPLLPLVTGPKPEAGFLPKAGGNAIPQAFKQDYISQFKLATSLLALGQPVGGRLTEVELDSATPPDETKLKEEFDQMVQKRQATAGAGAAAMVMTPDPKEQVNYERNRVLNKATELRMYLDPQAFQMRSWSLGADAPNEQQVFEAMVDSWLQGDVIKAINGLNTRALGPSAKDISKAPIKRLIHIAVGNSARAKVGNAPMIPFSNPGVPTGIQATDTGDLFFTSQAALQGVGMAGTGPLVNGGAAPAQPAAPNTIDQELSMTGHASGGEYDVVLMSIWMDIDPAYLNDFIDQLYRQNMGYTVLSTRFKTVDPLERSSNGFMYGEGQVIEVQLQVEAILFRGWTTALMPDAVKNLLGIPLTAAPK